MGGERVLCEEGERGFHSIARCAQLHALFIEIAFIIALIIVFIITFQLCFDVI